MITIPAIDLRDGKVVRLRQGDPGAVTIYADDPVAMAERFQADGARLIHVVDLDAALDSGDNKAAVTRICAAVDVPVQTGGGLRTLAAIEAALGSGALRAVLGTAAAADPEFVANAVAAFGDRVVVALDVRERRVMTHGWTKDAGDLDDLLADLMERGVPRFMLTQISADGMMTGPDLELYHHAAALTDKPMIASGGVRTPEDLHALASTGVEGAIVGKAIYEGAVNLKEVTEL